MTTKLVKSIAANHLRSANPRSKNTHISCHSEHREESLLSKNQELRTTNFFKFGRTNPIQKSLTYLTERTNPKIAKQKQTQTNPLTQLWITFGWRINFTPSNPILRYNHPLVYSWFTGTGCVDGQ